MAARRLLARALSSSASPPTPPQLLSLADLTVPQLGTLLASAAAFKQTFKAHPVPLDAQKYGLPAERDALKGRTVALVFSKRSTRTRVASESATALLGKCGHAMFLGSQDIQLGVNETLLDSAKVISSMVDGIMARVGDHSEVETLARYSTVPVINALSHLYHPSQILAHLLTLLETYSPSITSSSPPSLSALRGLTVAWIGDSNNILNDMIVSFARLGIHLRVATPKGYPLEEVVMHTAREGLAAESSGGTATKEVLSYFNDPLEAVKGADVLVTDTWISMGQEAEKQKRLKDFQGFQITMDLANRGGANKDWKFTHCLPRKQEEVDDEVFYGDRSLAFLEAENRKVS
ncbi:MAG: ornithine carbamoyltransferase [Cyphobasidiales sp. Tagirdzhanova-0007]|nr:MAG: ornithine carbamoyltransferase [Cyphobasidiales sp. Tagirdzhanova-0007]